MGMVNDNQKSDKGIKVVITLLILLVIVIVAMLIGFLLLGGGESGDDSKGISGATPESTPPPEGKTPSIKIISVEPDKSLTIEASGFPTSLELQVSMGKVGTEGINVIQITKTNTGTTGIFIETYDVPAELRGEDIIVIRLEGDGNFAFNTFNNQKP
jgi:hypothetical protein